MVDEKGASIWGDYLMIIFARDILKNEKGGCLRIGGEMLEESLRGHRGNGGVPIMWKAGHSLIKQKMKEVHAALGGEMSGHMFFADRYFGFDDAIYASWRLLEILARDRRRLSDFLSDLPPVWSTPEIRMDCPEDVKFTVVRKITDTTGRDSYRGHGWCPCSLH